MYGMLVSDTLQVLSRPTEVFRETVITLRPHGYQLLCEMFFTVNVSGSMDSAAADAAALSGFNTAVTK